MLKDKVVFVTGSAKGLGKSIAIALAKRGAILVIHYKISEREAKKTLEEVKKFSNKSFLVKGDLTDKMKVRSIFEEIMSKLERLDVLVNNVGDFIFKPISKTSAEEFRKFIRAIYCRVDFQY